MRVAWIGLIGVLVMSNATAELSLPLLFGDSMVLQRGKPIPVWGEAAPGEAVSVSLNGASAEATADEQGTWSTALPAMDAGGPYELTVAGADAHITITDVLIGDVWVCSGQSNMAFMMRDVVKAAPDRAEEIASADYPNLRLFTVSKTTAIEPLEELADVTPWARCTPESAATFSAVGYHFGRHLMEHGDTPIGLITSAWGGTLAEPWVSKEGLAALPWFADRLAEAEANLPRVEETEAEFIPVAEAWEAELDAMDAGVRDGEPLWSDPDVATTDWESVELPFPISLLGGVNPLRLGGRTWLRRDVELPASWAGRDLILTLSLVRETGCVWFNGVEVHRFNLLYRMWDGQAASIPGDLVREGRNTIVVRVTDAANMGGIYGEPEAIRLVAKDADATPRIVNVAGTWLMKPGLPVERLTPRPAPPNYWPNNPNMPTVLYSAMIHPLLRMPITGVIWYQGESNAAAAYEYRRLFPALIRDWRRVWGIGDFPFLFVQLANFGAWQPVATEPRDATWAELREAQLMTLSEPNTAMAVAIDVGDPNEIHPVNKKAVGERLGLAARAIAYGEPIPYSGPIYDAMEVRDGKASIAFTHAGNGLRVEGERLTGFAIAGADREFVAAEARIEGDRVIVWNDAVAEPVAVRYGWDYAPECNLYNAEMLPASPFRTDDWPGLTAPKGD